MQDEIWHQFGIQNYNGAVLSVYSVGIINIWSFCVWIMESLYELSLGKDHKQMNFFLE